MTDQERIDREALLKRAAVVTGAVYLAPVVTSAAAAVDETDACAGQTCKPGKKGKKKCKKVGGKFCKCINGKCTDTTSPCPCTRQSQEVCSAPESCGPGCFCHVEANGAGAVCVNPAGGGCADFTPCPGGTCPSGFVCMLSCCPQPLCLPCCSSSAASVARSAGSGGSLYASG